MRRLHRLNTVVKPALEIIGRPLEGLIQVIARRSGSELLVSAMRS